MQKHSQIPQPSLHQPKREKSTGSFLTSRMPSLTATWTMTQIQTSTMVVRAPAALDVRLAPFNRLIRSS